MRIVRLCNFITPDSGGIRIALKHWGEEWTRQGHDVHLIIPGPGPRETVEAQGIVHRLPATPILATDYSLMWSRPPIARLLERLRPDRVEVSDRGTLRWVARWAKFHGVKSVMISHENMTGIMTRRTPLPDAAARWFADFSNRGNLTDFDRIVAPSRYAAQEFLDIGGRCDVVPLGVDLETFQPPAEPPTVAPNGAVKDGRTTHLIHTGRFAVEKQPWLSIEAIRDLTERGHYVHLTMLGQGPMREELEQRAADLPVTFHSYIHGRDELAKVMGAADVALSPGPVETFGLAGLEALACGTPVVCVNEGGLHEVIGNVGGRIAESNPRSFADGALSLLAQPDRREAARAQAERYHWDHSAANMLAVHESLG